MGTQNAVIIEYPLLVRNCFCDISPPCAPQAAVMCCNVCWPRSPALKT